MADDDGYQGAGWVVTGERTIPVELYLSGRFEPIDGRYRWAGRIAPNDQVTALLSADRSVTIRTADGEAAGNLTEPDPWGGCRVAGLGAPPFALPEPPAD